MIMNLYYKYTHIWHMDEQNIIDSFVWLSCLTNVSENNQWQKIGNIGVGLWLGKIHRRLLRMTGRLYGFDPIAAIAFVHYVCHLGFPIWLHWNPIKYIYNYTYNHHQLWYTVWTTVASWLYESPKVTSSNCLCVGPRSQVQVSLVSSWNYVAGCFGMFHLNPYWVPIIPSTAESTNQVISAYCCVGEHVAFISLVLRSDDPTFQNWINNNMQHM